MLLLWDNLEKAFEKNKEILDFDEGIVKEKLKKIGQELQYSPIYDEQFTPWDYLKVFSDLLVWQNINKGKGNENPFVKFFLNVEFQNSEEKKLFQKLPELFLEYYQNHLGDLSKIYYKSFYYPVYSKYRIKMVSKPENPWMILENTYDVFSCFEQKSKEKKFDNFVKEIFIEEQVNPLADFILRLEILFLEYKRGVYSRIREI